MARTPIAIGTSDWHLDELIWADRPRITGDSYWSLRQLVDAAITTGVPILAAGDLIDQKENFSEVPFHLSQQLDRLQADKLPLYYVQGQHELQSIPWLAALHRWPVHLPQAGVVTLRPGDVKVCGLDWTPRERLPEELKRVDDRCELLVGHQVMQEFMGDITIPEMNSLLIPNGVRLFLVGDYHKTQVRIAPNSSGGMTHILSPGSTHMRALNEPSEKYYFVIYDDLTYESERLETRPYLEELARDELDMERIAATLPQRLAEARARSLDLGAPDAVATPVVRVVYAETLTGAYGRLKSIVGRQGHLFTRVEAAAAPDAAALAEVVAAGEQFELQGLAGCLPLVLPEASDPDAFVIAQRLLTNERTSPGETLSQLRRESFGLT